VVPLPPNGQVRGSPPQVRRALRQAHAKPILDALKPWFEASLARVPKGCKLGEVLVGPEGRLGARNNSAAVESAGDKALGLCSPLQSCSSIGKPLSLEHASRLSRLGAERMQALRDAPSPIHRH